MANVFVVLESDHEKLKTILYRLGHGESGGRKELVEELVIEESKHEAVEEMYFWPAVREAVSGGGDLADTALEQEGRGKVVLANIAEAGADGPELPHLISTFTLAALEHIAFEEQEVWPKLRSVLDSDAQDHLGQKLEDAKRTAPTRPHPATPPKPGLLKTAGAAVAATDRIRDKLSGRGD